MYTSLLFSFAGILYAVAGASPVFEYYHNYLAEALYGSEELPENAETMRRFASGPVGGTIACAYLLLAFIAAIPFRQNEKWAWIAIFVSFLMWFVVDSIVCMISQVYFQAYVINVISLAIKILPLLFTRKYFFRAN